jgi:hypothetical protein
MVSFVFLIVFKDEDDDGELNIPRKNSNIEQKNINFGNNLTVITFIDRYFLDDNNKT